MSYFQHYVDNTQLHSLTHSHFYFHAVCVAVFQNRELVAFQMQLDYNSNHPQALATLG